MVYGGNAFGKHEGRAIFAVGGLPGEVVRVRITEDRGRYAVGVVEEVITPSPHRVSVPRCPYFRARTCGGCQWQHIDYAAQVEYKTEIVREQFRRIGRLPDAPVLPMIASPDEWFYRTHVTFHAAPNGELGFVAPEGRIVTPIHECYIIRPELLILRERLDGAGKHVRVMVGSDGSDDAVVADGTPPDEDESSGARPARASVTFTIGTERLGSKTFHVNGASFFQVNLAQTARLVELVLGALDLDAGSRALDLYAGVGLFTAFIAQQAAGVTAVELAASAVGDARRNLARFSNVTILEGAVESVLPRVKGRFDAAVIDPPRAGMKRAALDALIARAPRRIAYVSCDPSTLARDVRLLVDAGYTLTHVQPVDMFPHTYHIECVVGLEKSR